MADNFVGEIRLFAGNFAPQGWAICDGSLLPIQKYQTLFSLIGTTYGGDGVKSFSLPDLKGKIPVHKSLPNSLPNSLPSINVGVKFGTKAYTIKTENMPPHSHTFYVISEQATNSSPQNMMFAKFNPSGPTKGLYSKNITSNTTLDENFLSTSGGAESPTPITNMMPTITLNYIIALNGVYPFQP